MVCSLREVTKTGIQTENPHPQEISFLRLLKRSVSTRNVKYTAPVREKTVTHEENTFSALATIVDYFKGGTGFAVTGGSQKRRVPDDERETIHKMKYLRYY